MNVNGPKYDKSWYIVVGAFVVAYAVVLVRTAWICDDAYISLRTVDNFLQGYGLRWNTAERVQVFTHPLWVLLLSSVSYVTRELYLTTIALSIAASLAAFLLILKRLSKSVAGAIVGGLALLLAPGFVSFSTSGLEQPLSYLFVAVFMIVFIRSDQSPKRSFILAATAGLAMLNRLDLLWLFVPALAFDLFENRRIANVRAMAIGFLPFFAWLVFSLVYYGFLIPNSAYAKLSTGIPFSFYAKQGMAYLYDALLRETLMSATIVFSLTWALISKRKERRMLALGVLLYLVYLVTIGGDFMRGRLLAAPFLVAVGLLVDQDLWRRRLYSATVPAIVVILLLGFAVPTPTVLSGSDFGKDKVLKAYYKTYGIAYERKYYYQMHGLLNGKPLSEKLGHDMRALRERHNREVTGIKIITTAGKRGMEAGPNTYLIDNFALSNAMLSRLPVREVLWRIGHFPRRVPAGYLMTLATGDNQIEDDRLRDFYDRIALITRGPLFSTARWRAIFEVNSGRLRDLVRYNMNYEVMDTDDCIALANWDVDIPGPTILMRAARFHCQRSDISAVTPILARLSRLEIEHSDEYVEEFTGIGSRHFESGDRDFGERLLELICELEPADPTPPLVFGSLLIDVGRLDEGARYLTTAAGLGNEEAKRRLVEHRAR